MASPDGLFVYSAEHKTSRPAFAWIPFKHIIRLSTPSYSENAMAHLLALTLVLPWKEEEELFRPTPLSSRFKDQVVEGGILDKKNHFHVKIHVCADSKVKMDRWKEFLECHIARHHRH